MHATATAAPVLVTGAPRTGTTWLGRMLSLSGELAEVYEPFNPNARQARWFEPPHHYLHVDDGNEAPFVDRVAQMARLQYPLAARLLEAPADGKRSLTTWRAVRAHRRAGRAALVKDPLALFATPWLTARFGFRPVLIVRHPCGFVSSVLRVRWTINFGSWLSQPQLMASLLAPWHDEIAAAAARPSDELRDAALLWKVCNGVINRYEEEHPEWVVVRHEDLARDPVAAFEALYATLGLTWSAPTAARVAAENSDQNPAEVADGRQHQMARDSRAVADVWRGRLTPEEIYVVEEIAAGVAGRHYPEVAPI